jgi:site-specific DNA-methyltransferase (adenine-specific)
MGKHEFRRMSTSFRRNTVQRGDALALLQSLPDHCTPLVFFDPQHRENLDKLRYGNEGARQKERFHLPAMTSEFIDSCCRESVRVLVPSGYLMLWQNAFGLVQGHHLRLAGVLQGVDLVAWDNQHLGMGYRARRRGHGIPDRWSEKVDRKLHPHIKPIGLISRLIVAVTNPGDLVVDPAAGSFAVMHAAIELGREFIGCDIEAPRATSEAPITSPSKPIPSTRRKISPAQSRRRILKGNLLDAFPTTNTTSC